MNGRFHMRGRCCQGGADGAHLSIIDKETLLHALVVRRLDHRTDFFSCAYVIYKTYTINTKLFHSLYSYLNVVMSTYVHYH